MKKGDILELDINGYAYEGKGFAKINTDPAQPEKKLVIFVEGTYPGDKVQVFIKKKKSNYAEAVVEKIIKASPLRKDAECKYFGVCGGCKQQDLGYNDQIRYKTEQISETFRHIGLLDDFQMEPIVESEKKYFYRNKMEFSFSDKRWISKEEFNSGEEIIDRNFGLGLHIPRIFDKVLNLDECFLQSEQSNKILKFTQNFFKEKKIEAFSPKLHTGFLRNLVIKQAHFTNDLMVNLVTSAENDDLLQEYSDKIIKEIPEITTVINNINTKLSQVAYGDYEKVYYGHGIMYDFIGNYKFQISANSFFQVNTRQAVNLYQTALDYAELSGNEIVYDLYSGAGTIAIFISSFAKSVYTFESADSSIADAGRNIQLNNIKNVNTFNADLNKSFLPIVHSSRIPSPDVIIVDPPRSGMNPKTIQDILALAPKKVVYVSCNPATQARDIKLLAEGGYKLVKIRPVDMFPQTYHIENVALLVR